MDRDGVVYRNKKDSHRQCRVVFSYQPVHPDELALNIGEIINIIGEDEEGWWRGVHNEKQGVFPSNFVEEIFPSKPKIKSDSHEDLPNIINDTEVNIPILPQKPTKILCEVKYAYKAQNEDELSMKEGDIITLTNKDLADPGWWEGELNGKVGVFPDNFVVIIKQTEEKSPQKDDSKHPRVNSDCTPLKPTATIFQRTSLEPKNEIDTKPNPPLLKKPDLLKKISPSSVTKGFRGLVTTRKSDIVDGIASSKGHQVKNDVKVEVPAERNGENAFDQVERNPLLKDVRAGRAKPPIRRPPTSAVATKDKSPNLDTEEVFFSEEEPQEMKPSLREWEKHKAPWLAEMKINQAKRSFTSPISEKNLDTKGLYPELDKSPGDGIMSKSMPCPATSKISPIEPLIDTKPPTVAKAKPNNLQNLPRNNYSNVDIPLSVNNSFSISPTTTNTRSSLTITNKFNKSTSEKQSNSSITCNNSSGSAERPDNHNSRVGGESQDPRQETMVLTVQQYTNLEERLRKLEMLVETQATAIEELKGKLLIESDKRKLLESQKLT